MGSFWVCLTALPLWLRTFCRVSVRRRVLWPWIRTTREHSMLSFLAYLSVSLLRQECPIGLLILCTFSPREECFISRTVMTPLVSLLHSFVLFDSYLRRLGKVLLADVRTAMSADHLLLYCRHGEPRRVLVHLEWAVGLLTPWLRELGLSISIPKCQLCLFTRPAPNCWIL